MRRFRSRIDTGISGRVRSYTPLIGGDPGPSSLLTDLISYWKLDEESGNAIDSTVTGNDLGEINSVGFAPGKIGNARDFESGSPAYFSIANNASLEVGDIDFTLACWVNAESLTNQDAILGKWGGAESSYILEYNASAFRFRVSDNGGSVSTDVTAGTPSTAAWFLVIAWHDATANTTNIQVNNGTPGSAAHSTGVFAGTAAFTLGFRASGGLWDGLIDELGFWKRVLTTDERAALYNGGNGTTYPFL